MPANGAYSKFGRQRQQQQERGARTDHAAGCEPARPETIRQIARNRSRDQESGRERQHVDAGPQRRRGVRVSALRQPDALQPNDQHEHQTAAPDRRQKAGQICRRELPIGEQLQTKHRIADAALDQNEGGHQRDSGAQLGQHSRIRPAHRVARVRLNRVGDGDQHQHDPGRIGEVAPPIDARAPARAKIA